MRQTDDTAVLLIAFGGPERPEEIRPFLAHVLRGRPVPAERIESVAHHYELIGGRSPINELTEAQRAALQARLRARGFQGPVRTGMRHAKPFIAETLAQLVAQGIQRIVGVVMASFYDSATVQRYAAAVDEAKQAIGCTELRVDYISGPSEDPGFITACAEQIRQARAKLPTELRDDAGLVFTAHSVPSAVGEESGYVVHFESTAAKIAQALGVTSHRLAYQSRSGSPKESWLEPDICRVIEAAKAGGERALVVAPIGFVCDHVEVLYDLDIEAAQRAQALALAFARAATVGTHPAYIDALERAVLAALA